MTDYRLDPERVMQVFEDCLGGLDGIPGDESVVVHGITAKFALRKDKLERHREEIDRMLFELPPEFRSGHEGGGGWSFLGACNDRHGNQWTGLHMRMQELFCLGLGTGRVFELFPPEMRDALPGGGMPYYVIRMDPDPGRSSPFNDLI